MRFTTRRKPWRGFPSINAVHGIRGYFRQDMPAPVGDNLTPVLYDALPLNKSLHLGTLPPGSFVSSVHVHVKTLFNGTTPAVIVGTAADDDGILTAAQSAVAVAGYKPNLTGGALLGRLTDETELFVKLTGTGVTAGEIDFLIEFYMNQD
jgi:hypothetical protein